MSAAPGVRTQDRPCADGLEQSALRLHRRAVPREAAFWLVGYVFGAIILGTALPVPLYAIYQRQWHFSAYALNGLFASLVPGFTTVMLHHPDYAVAGGVTCLFFAAGAVAALGLAPFNSRPVLLGGLGLFLVGLALVVAGMSAASLALFLVGAVVAGSAFGALVIGSLSAVNRLAAPGTRAKAISTYFVFAYAGLSIPVVGVGVASDYVRQLPGRARLFHRAGRAVRVLGRPRRRGGRPLIYGVGGYGACPGTSTFQERAASRCCEAAGAVIQDRGGPNDDRRPDTTAADPQHDPGSPRPAPLVAVPYPPGPRARHCSSTPSASSAAASGRATPPV